MLGMSLLSFLTLSVIGAAVAVTYHNVIRYRFLEGNDGLFGKLIIGWFGAWLGSPILGHWFWKVENIYVVPAILGAIAAIHLTVSVWKALAKLASIQPVIANKIEETDKTEKVRPGKQVIAT